MSDMTLDNWNLICRRLNEAKELLRHAFDLLIDRQEMDAAIKISDIVQSLTGLSYMCHPQPEWMGGDKETSTWKIRPPHISTTKERYIQ